MDILQILLSLLNFYYLYYFILFGLYAGTNCTKNCKWSLSAPICQKFILYLLDISRYITFIIIRSSSSFIIIFLYLTGHINDTLALIRYVTCAYTHSSIIFSFSFSIVLFPIRYDKVCFRSRTAGNQIWRD